MKFAKSMLLGVLAAGLSVAAEAAEVKVGDVAPAIAAKDQNGKEWKLAEHLGKPYLVVYFYPAAMTGGWQRMADKPVVCFDGDAAGQRAAMRAVERALPMLRPTAP